VSVFTAEDPVEGTIAGFTQCQVNSAVGYNFATILRSLLRQDPDVVLVGEIRDQETAEISIKAALTGHLVLSTLHTNCAVSSISRLLNMGVADYLISSAVSLVVAQRLVRRICPDCIAEQAPSPRLMERLGGGTNIGDLINRPLKYGSGCKNCNGSGYKGRAPIYEVLSMSDTFRQAILHGTSRDDLKILARREGMITLREAGLELIRKGITTPEEVLGASNEDPPLDAISTPTTGPATPTGTTVHVVSEAVPAMPLPAPTPVSHPQDAPANSHVVAVETPPIPQLVPAAPAPLSPASVVPTAAETDAPAGQRWRRER
jgi:type II secretory ATPase GspE/PulE/Tfp pilus assembly ATPase PilB-like protein